MKNFKSFSDEEIKFNPKTNINYIYGANGIGKSTIISIATFINDLFSKELNLYDHNRLPAISRNQKALESLSNIYKKYATIGSENSIQLSIEFVNNEDSDYFYRYEIELIEGDIFIKEAFSKINNKGEEYFFFNKKLNKEFIIGDFSEKFKDVFSNVKKNTSNSIISILFREININNEVSEISNSDEWKEIINLMYLFFVRSNEFPFDIHGMIEKGFVLIPKMIAGFPGQNSKLDPAKKEISKWKKFIEEFETFAMSIDKNILGIEFKYKSDDPINHIVYYEFIKKTSGGKQVNVPVNMESSGTKLYLSHYFNMVAIKNDDHGVIMIDEFGQNLHEELIIKLSNYMSESASKNNKQIILTTHSAILLNDKFVNKSKNWNKERLILNRRSSGELSLNSLEGENVRENNHMKFLRGLYGGTPDITGVYTEYDE